jgi:hypothetical protein
MKTIIATAALALCAAGCSASFSSGKSTDKSSLDGKPIGSDDDDMGKPIANDERSGDAPGHDDHDTAKSELASPSSKSPTSTMKDGDCVPGNAKGHTKDKAQGEAVGHDKPPCPDNPDKEPVKTPTKSSKDPSADKAADKADEKAGDKASGKAAPLKSK